MNIYIDICALKRPWDDQGQSRIALETAAMIELMVLIESGVLKAIRSPTHDEENDRNSDPARAGIIRSWLSRMPLPTNIPDGFVERVHELTGLGLLPFDALHLCWAEALSADLLVTTDDAFVRRGSRESTNAKVQLVTPPKALEFISRSNES